MVDEGHGEPDWESARPAQMMPPEAMPPVHHTPSPSNPLARPQRDSRTPSAGGRPYPPPGGPSTLPGLASPPHGSNPSLPFPHGSLPGGGPVGPGGYPQVSKATAEAMAMAPTQLGPMNTPAPQGFAANPGSSVSHSHVTPYPQPSGVDGYESLKPTRRPLYIGLGLALVGVIIALAIGSAGDGPDDATPDPTPPETASVQPIVAPSTDPGIVPPPVATDPVPATGSGGTAATPPSTGPAPVPTPVPDKALLPSDPGPGTTADTPDTDTPVTPDKDKAPVEDVPPSEPATIAVVIKSDPTGADVFKEGKRVGKTPFETTLPQSEKSTTFTVRADRHIDESVTVKHAKDFTATLKLEKKRVVRVDKPDKTDKPDKPKGPCRKKGQPKNPFLPEKDQLPPCD
jgi:hypothetical protein